MSEQGRELAAAPADFRWRAKDALDLASELNRVSETVIAVIAAGGDFDRPEVARSARMARAGIAGVAECVSEVRGSLEAIAQRWGLSKDVVDAEKRRRSEYLDARFLARKDGQWPVKESADAVEVLAAGDYAVAATLAARGDLDRLEVPWAEEGELGSREWLAQVFGQLIGVLWSLTFFWLLPLDVSRAVARNKRRELRKEWAQEAA